MSGEACTSASHELLKVSPLWEGLPFVGYQRSYVDGEDELRPDYECRNCTRCDSTLLRARRAHPEL